MRIGLFTDSLQDLPFTEALDWIAMQGIEAVEIGTGNFSNAPHCDVDKLLQDPKARAEFKAAVESRGLTLSALNCNGNLLDPHPERRKRSQNTLKLSQNSLLGLKQGFQVVFNDEDAQKSAIGFLAVFTQAVEPTTVVDPGEGALNLPALPTVPFVVPIFRRTTFGHRDMVFAIGDDGDDPAATEFAPQGFTVIPLVHPQALGPTAAFADADALKGFQNVDLVIAVRPAQREIEGVAVRVRDDVAFNA